jgi:putative transposase
MQPSPDILITRRFGPFDRIGIDIGGKNPVFYRCLSSNAAGHRFERVDQPGVVESFSHEDIARIETNPTFRYDRRWFDHAYQEARLRSEVDHLGDIPERERADILWKYEWCMRFRHKESIGETSRSDAAIMAIIPILETELADSEAARIAKPRAGSKRTLRAPPSLRSLRRWLAALESCGLDPIGLRNGYRRCGPDAPTLDADLEALVQKHVSRYAANTKPSMTLLFNDLLAEVQQLNATRLTAGLEAFKAPCDKVFFNRIRAMPAFATYAARNGVVAARNKFWMISSGVGTIRPGERVEFDGWTIPLHKPIADTALWRVLSPEQQELIKRERWICCAAVDVGTRCILALRIAPTSTAKLAVSTVAMALADKGPYADAVGSLSPWSMHMGIETAYTDMGSEFGADFRAVLKGLRIEVDSPPAGLAQMRAHIERLFGTAHTQLVARFTGRAFANIAEKGDYPAEAQASATVDDIARAFVRYAVDVYHNQPHDGLGGETPLNAWNRLTRLYGAPEFPNADCRRNVFGVKVSRALTTRGVRFLGVYYQSLELQQHRRKVGDCDVEAIVDPAEMGWASVNIGGTACLSVPCMAPMQGVCIEDWIATCADLSRRFGNEAEIAQPIALAALRDIQSMSDAAARRANIGSTMLTAEDVNRAEHRLHIPWSPPADSPAGQGADDSPPDLFSDAITPAPRKGPAATPNDENPSAKPGSDWTVEE